MAETIVVQNLKFPNNDDTFQINAVRLDGKTAATIKSEARSGLASTSYVTEAVSGHNTNSSAHSDIRASITNLTTQVNNFLDVDDTTKDQLSEVLAMIDANEGTIESLTTNKVNVSDIVNNLTSSATNKPLSAAQGKALNEAIKAIPVYTLPTAGSTLGGVKTTSTVTSTSGLTACPIIKGVPYYKNSTYSNTTLGQGYGTCATAAATAAKVVTLSSYTLTKGGIVAVKFTYDVPANATMNINSKGAKSIYYKGKAIVSGVICAGEVATFMYDGTNYHLLSVDRNRFYTTLIPYGTQITASETSTVNINSSEYFKVGNYYCAQNAQAKYISNLPEAGVAFMMQVISPLSQTIDNETGTWVYRIRKLTHYQGREYIQYCYTNGTGGNWIIGAWQKVMLDSMMTSYSQNTHTHTVAYTPAGTVSTPTITVTPNTTNVYSITAVGTLPSLTYTAGTASNITAWSAGSAPTASLTKGSGSFSGAVSTGPNRVVTLSHGHTASSLTFSAGSVPSLTYSAVDVDNITAWSAGTLPTKGSATSVVTSIKSATSTQPTFTGTAATLTTSAANA